MEAAALARVQAIAVEGRMRNIRTRQHELRSLYRDLDEHKDEFIEAMLAEGGYTEDEAKVVTMATLLDIRKHYNALNLEKEMEVEYRIKNGKSSEERRLPARIVYILPDSYTLMYSVFSALGGAIEAGCCCVVELPITYRKTDSLIRQSILRALDKHSFATISSRAPKEFLNECLVVDQSQQLPTSDLKWDCLLSVPTSRTLAIVDRTGDVKAAAKDILASRVSFGAQSPYATDLVFVNEFVVNTFLEAVDEILSKIPAQNSQTEAMNSRSLGFKQDTEQSDRAMIEDGLKDGSCKVVLDRKGVRIVEVLKQSSPLLQKKITSRTVVFFKITSLDDSIELVVDNRQPLLALYVFAALPEAKYLAQFIDTRITFVSHISAKMQIGPACNIRYAAQTELRYTREMFEEPSPQIVPGDKRPGKKCHPVSVLFPKVNPKLIEAPSEPLKPTGQGRPGAWGFFEQGLLLGATVYLLPVALLSVAGVTIAGTAAYQKLYTGRLG